MIFTPTYSVPGEWQGTVIINKFDPAGAYLGQYVADVAMVPDPTGTFWDVQLEVSYEDGVAYLQYGDPAAYDNLGTPGAGGGSPPPIIGGTFLGRAASFERASFTTTPQGRFPRPPTNPSPKVRQVMKCTTIGATGVGVACGIGSLLSAGTAFLPCFGAWGAAALTVCTLTAIFGP